MTDQIEAAIVARIESQVSLTVKAFPSTPDDYKKLPFNRGLVLVAYSGSDLSDPTNRDEIVQQRAMEFSVTLQVRDLRGHEGAYSYLEQIRTALSGFSPMNDLNVMFMTSEALLSVVENVWVWGQKWQLEMRQT